MLGFVSQNDVVRVERWLEWPWLEHGFGTRSRENWTPVEQTVTLKQIHSDVVVSPAAKSGCAGEGDALITNKVGTLLAIRTADCIPVLLVDPMRKVVAAVHAGWRGSAAHIAARAVERMAVEFGSNPADVHASIGPGIGACCYEVGAEVADRFASRQEVNGKTHVDLKTENVEQLTQAGVPRAKIEVTPDCTQCISSTYHSFRRDGKLAGRMVSLIGIRA